MKRFLLAFLLCICFGPVRSQNYQCVQDGFKRYFTNSDRYLKGIRIDSVRTYPDSTVYFPFRSRRGAYTGSGTGIFSPDANGGCWIGSRVTQLTDGTYWFENIWHDTVVIKTQVGVGDSWIFYSDTSNIYYRADVISKAPQTIYGTTDSVIALKIAAYGPGGYIASDPVDTMVISISKNYGFYELFDLYLFPFRKTAFDAWYAGSDKVVDYFFQFCGSKQFRLTEFYNAMSDEVYGFNLGDVFENHSDCNITSPSENCKHHSIDTTINKTVISSSQISYTFQSRQETQSDFPPSHTFNYSSFTTTVNVYPIFSNNLMPEEQGIDRLYYYDHYDTSYCITGPYYGYRDQFFAYGLGVFPGSYSYKIGLGQTFARWCYNTDFGSYNQKILGFAQKGSISCGTFYPISVANVTYDLNIPEIFPNPASGTIQIISDFTAPYTVTISNLLGQVLIRTTGKQPTIYINVSNFPSGVYHLALFDEHHHRFDQKLSVVH